MTGWAEWGGQRRIVVLARDVMLLDSDAASAERATVLFRTPGQSPSSIERVFLHHADASGSA